MKLGPGCIGLIKEFESCRLQAYPDPATHSDPWTIGWGSTGPDIGPGTTWTQTQADARLMASLVVLSAAMEKLVRGGNQNHFDAMCDLAYNIGTGNFGGSTLLKLHNAGDYNSAASEFPKWDHAAGVVMPGLLRRRLREQTLYLTREL